MRIFHPVRGFDGARREDSFMISDDAGVEIGGGSLKYRSVELMMPECPLEMEISMQAHPQARDTLFGALTAHARQIQAAHGMIGARLYVRCALDDQERREYFMRMGFDDYDGMEQYVLDIQNSRSRRRKGYPVGTQSLDTGLDRRIQREEFLIAHKRYGCVEHASEWLEERMKSPLFMAKTVYYGKEIVGHILVTEMQQQAVLDMICVDPKWRKQGVASAMLDEVIDNLNAQHVPYLYASAARRNQRAVYLFGRFGFDWIRTSEYLLGCNLRESEAKNS